MSENDPDPVAHGIAVFGEMHPPARASAFRAATDPTVAGGRMQGFAAEFVFGRLWDDTERLDRRSRGLVTLGLLLALKMGDEFSNHVRVALANGLTAREIEEAIPHAAAYVGFPTAHAAMIVAARVLAKRADTVPAGQPF